ncbi:hypothetical protein Q0A17_23230 [Citrobacter sp. S2-9]|uniref:Uncharacterized protein n=1 Tax=Citrobacter enshiensis TaxID=2971264 RepID=A0ABT8Q0U1_9ENTR|nr:hypothetical protein [Citrobacter enshiensis]MDN8602294.1 hypothetical protein [Citrobacter enshiensis]
MNIDKNENILVIIKHDGLYHWFSSFKEMWILDRIKWINDFIASGVKGIDIDDHLERYNIATVNKNNSIDFIQRLKDDNFLIDKNKLADEFYKRITSKSTWWDVYDLFPDLFIDFDSLILYSEYVEVMHYEKYIPDGWVSELKDFCAEPFLPLNEMFWIKNGIDHRKNIILKG